jgi:class 3 adenylate cyclase/tetratricopeptide (TPR) repeat protein
VDVGTWLRNLGLEQYEAAFRENAVGADILSRLTADDLKDLGIASVGHRRKLLDAILDLRSATLTSMPSFPAAVPASPSYRWLSQRALQVAAERRPITVMFCDLVGSTSLAARLDAEDWRNLVGVYVDEASAAVTSLGAHVVRRFGDGLMVLFGYPHAQENDAERAVRAALAIQRALSQLNDSNAGNGPPALYARIGIELGSVVVDTTGEVFGEAPNVAARVQAAAEPGSVLITMNVQRQVAGLFVVEERGSSELKGILEPVQLFRVIRASGAGRRGVARLLTSFIGRDEELDLLARRWGSVRTSEGQFVLIVSEPGLGKSRLIEEFQAGLAQTLHTWVEWRASQLLQNTPLHPIAEWGRLRFDVNAPAEERLTDLQAALRLIGLDPVEHTPLLAPLVDIPLPPGSAAAFAPEELRRRQLAALVTWLLAGARSQPIVLVFEDLQWADPTSLDLLHALAERGGQVPLFLIATSRPEFRPSWSMRSHHSAFSLAPLKRAEVYHMVGELASGHALSKDVIEGVSERTGGVPLFIEEMTRLLLERGDRESAQTIPLTLQQSLAARLDRLGEAREIAQVGAVLGRNFSYRLLRAVAATNDTALHSALERLLDANILFVEGSLTHSTYRFKHALIQDAAYGSMLRTRRRALHRIAGEVLTGQPESLAPEPEVIAHHFTQAGLDRPAIEWWGKAGDQALRRSAFLEAIAHLGKAIEITDRAEPFGTRSTIGPDQRDRIKLQNTYARALIYVKGVAAEETKAALERAWEFGASRTDADDAIGFRARWTQHFYCGEFDKAEEVAERGRLAANDQGRTSDGALLQALVGSACVFRGDLQRARTLLEQALGDSAFDLKAANRTRPSSGAEAIARATPFLALAVWHLGEPAAARRLIDQAEEWAKSVGGFQPVGAMMMRAILEGRRSDPEATLAAAERVIAMASEGGMATHVAVGAVYKSWAIGRTRDAATGLQEIREALQSLDKTGMRASLPDIHGLVADLEARAGDTTAALKEIDKGLAISAETGEYWTDPTLHSLRGTVLLKHNPTDPTAAENAYRTAIAIADQQGARSYVLLASLSLAKLLQSSARPADAHAILAPALEGFSSTPEMPEIAEAQAFLEILAHGDRG